MHKQRPVGAGFFLIIEVCVNKFIIYVRQTKFATKFGRQYIYTTNPFITTTNIRKYAKVFKSRKSINAAIARINDQLALEGWSMGTLVVVPR